MYTVVVHLVKRLRWLTTKGLAILRTVALGKIPELTANFFARMKGVCCKVEK